MGKSNGFVHTQHWCCMMPKMLGNIAISWRWRLVWRGLKTEDYVPCWMIVWVVSPFVLVLHPEGATVCACAVCCPWIPGTCNANWFVSYTRQWWNHRETDKGAYQRRNHERQQDVLWASVCVCVCVCAIVSLSWKLGWLGKGRWVLLLLVYLQWQQQQWYGMMTHKDTSLHLW